jgi:Dyp-type peroxidase family
LRDSSNIQGNILAGFFKDRQLLIFVCFADSDRARDWLTELLPRIATTDQVATFNERFSAARIAGGGDPDGMAAVWVGVSLTANGIRTLAESDPVSSEPNAFVMGAAGSADRLGDSELSAPDHWLFGRSDQVIDAIITLQADRATDFEVALARERAVLAAHGHSVVFEQRGDTLPGARAGHEHFGFKDGISQPGVRGFDEPDADHPDQVKGHPGTDLINPGEFVLGYPNQSGVIRPVPEWMKDGSFHVIRRLTQDVPGWWGQVEAQRARLPNADNLDTDLLAAKLVGRWRSGTPLALAPDRDLRSGRTPRNDNDFEYDTDPDGLKTPRFAHIRKVYPRNAEPPGEEESEKRRIIRRGIPFGLPFDPPLGRGYGVDAKRGLVFAAFMASIEEQFEFLQSAWANAENFPQTADGNDPIIGIDSHVTLKRSAVSDTDLDFARFVTTEGALYAFAPSLATLEKLASGTALS